MEAPAVSRSGNARRFFVSYGVLFVILTVIGFGPSLWDYFQEPTTFRQLCICTER